MWTTVSTKIENRLSERQSGKFQFGKLHKKGDGKASTDPMNITLTEAGIKLEYVWTRPKTMVG